MSNDFLQVKIKFFRVGSGSALGFCRWEDNIKMDLREIGIDGANWIRLAQDRAQWRVL
jgi:hypothetical protein